jgi:hypothetical protein
MVMLSIFELLRRHCPPARERFPGSAARAGAVT